MSESVEQWRPVLGFEGRYLISDQARAMNCKTGRIMRASPTGRGYLRVSLSNGSGRKVDRAVHRMLLESFVRPPRPGEVARHLNDDQQDNRLDNLAWGTPMDNTEDAARNGRCPLREPRIGLPSGRSLVEHYEDIRQSPLSVRALARVYKVSHSTIQRIKSGQQGAGASAAKVLASPPVAPPLEEQTWAPVHGYKGLYEISDWGVVRNLRTGCITKQSEVSGGYLEVRLGGHDGSLKRHLAHRLVLASHVRPRSKDYVARHLNKNPKDNRVVNLQWKHVARGKAARARERYRSPAQVADAPVADDWS